MHKQLTEKETSKLRDLYWKAAEANTSLQTALNEVAKAHGCAIEKERWNLSNDFKFLVKL